MGIKFQSLGNLCSVELGVGLEPGVGCTLCAAFVQANDTALSAPAFGEHTVGGKLRAGSHPGHLIASVAGKGDTSKIRNAEIAKMLDYGFANYETAVIAEAGPQQSGGYRPGWRTPTDSSLLRW